MISVEECERWTREYFVWQEIHLVRVQINLYRYQIFLRKYVNKLEKWMEKREQSYPQEIVSASGRRWKKAQDLGREELDISSGCEADF